MSFGAPAPTPGTWVCGICYCRRPAGQLWCSHLADRAARDRLHALLDGCDVCTCVPQYPCAACCEAIAVARIPWGPAYRCMGCHRGPGDEHRPDCDSEGTVPTIAEQTALLDRLEAAPVPVPCRTPTLDEQRAMAEEFPEFVRSVAAPLPPLAPGPHLPGLEAQVAKLADLLRARPELAERSGDGWTLTAPDGSQLALHVCEGSMEITSWSEPPTSTRRPGVCWVASCMPVGEVRRTIAGVLRRAGAR
jgi:hypothetical protein